ncbi:MAG: HD-GYP domain-containing protein [Defluviitaleaceae bacterium]|nr:HD-GYP domain-containing protein [Defluviitaleaceae bacterium]
MYTRIIKIEDAEPGMKLSEPVYIVTNTGSNMLAARAGMVLDANLIKMLTVRKVVTIEIHSDVAPEGAEIPPQKSAPAAPPPSIKVEPPKPPPEKYVPVKELVNDKLKEEAVDSVKQLFTCFATPDGGINKTTAYQCVSNLENVVGDLMGVITDDESGLIHINDLKQFDEYTYHHSLSVSMLAMTTGREMGLDEDTLFRLGRCAMMHDIGKQTIPIEIINKKGKLTDAEFTIIKNHPVTGANNLKAAAIGDIELWNGILFHHEKINGAGYPKGLKGKDIPLFSKIISVADVYDAVTSYRSYRLPMLPSEAFELIGRDVNVAFELNVVKAFFAKLELYPVNTILELSDGRLGMVVDSEGASRLRPTVRVWGSTELVNLAAQMNAGITIEGVINPTDLPPGYEFN